VCFFETHDSRNRLSLLSIQYVHWRYMMTIKCSINIRSRYHTRQLHRTPQIDTLIYTYFEKKKRHKDVRCIYSRTTFLHAMFAYLWNRNRKRYRRRILDHLHVWKFRPTDRVDPRTIRVRFPQRVVLRKQISPLNFDQAKLASHQIPNSMCV
jgi:hypothetical protein